MNGVVDDLGRAVVPVRLQSSPGHPAVEITAWVDTAFNGELVAPSQLISELGWEQSAGLRAKLADGSEVTLETYAGQIMWFGELREIEVIANEGQLPLLGVGLLLGRRLTVDYAEMTVAIE